MAYKLTKVLNDELSALIHTMGYEFVGAELSRSGGSGAAALRIYIDSHSGITLQDCSKVSHQVSAMLDVEDPIEGHYALEVSSPGLNRPLFALDHYHKQVGKRLKIRTKVLIQNKRNFSGILLRIAGEDIHLLMDEQEWIIPFQDIEKAQLIADIR